MKAGRLHHKIDGLSRRRWLQLMGASLALAGAGGCRWEKTELLPFAKRPPGRTPGKVEKFATAMELGGSALGLMVTCVDGRPIKIEGNPKHPSSLGATNAFAQAAILELYDPDRSKNHHRANAGRRRGPHVGRVCGFRQAAFWRASQDGRRRVRDSRRAEQFAHADGDAKRLLEVFRRPSGTSMSRLKPMPNRRQCSLRVGQGGRDRLDRCRPVWRASGRRASRPRFRSAAATLPAVG